jgi:shikimate kinase
MVKIILVGYMGSGKTTIGKMLSEYVGIPFYDLDDIIEKFAGNNIQTIFLQKGEIYFRKLEHKLFNEFVKNNNSFVLSLGGGTPCYANNHLVLQKDNIESFYLKNTVEELVSRLKNEREQRPLISSLSDVDLHEYISKHLFERNYFYFQSKNIIESKNKSKKEIVHEIIEKLA